MRKLFKVDASWLQACGKPVSPNTFPILRTERNGSPNPAFATMHVVLIDGRDWTVAACRGRVVADPSDPLAKAFQFHMRDMLACATRNRGRVQTDRQHALVAMRKARADVLAGKARYPEPINGYGNYWTQQDDAGNKLPAVRYVQHVAETIRFVGTAYDVARREHSRRVESSGWYLDHYQDETASGVVVQLPARNGEPQYYAGVQTSLDAGNDAGATVHFDSSFSEALDAASAADRLAELFAEREREYQSAFQAGSRFADLGDEIAASRTQALQLFRELKQARIAFPAPGDLTGLCSVIREKLAGIVREIADARAARRTLERGEGMRSCPELSFWTGDKRLVAAFQEGTAR